jgi:hypothetical protein
MPIYSNSSIEWLRHPKGIQEFIRDCGLPFDRFFLQICRSSKEIKPLLGEWPKNSWFGMSRRYLNEGDHTILIEISQHDIEFISKEPASG